MNIDEQPNPADGADNAATSPTVTPVLSLECSTPRTYDLSRDWASLRPSDMVFGGHAGAARRSDPLMLDAARRAGVKVFTFNMPASY